VLARNYEGQGLRGDYLYAFIALIIFGAEYGRVLNFYDLQYPHI